MTRLFIIAAVLAALLASLAVAQADEQAELKQRFKERYPTLVQLKRADKVGEVFDGTVGAVTPRAMGEKVDEETTVAQFLAAENRDRLRLYQLIAQDTGVSPAVVAARNAQRNFEKAGPNEFLKPQDKDWTRKRDIR